MMCHHESSSRCAGVLGSDLLKEHVQCGSAAYWAVVCSVVPLVLLVTVLARAQKRSPALHRATLLCWRMSPLLLRTVPDRQ